MPIIFRYVEFVTYACLEFINRDLFIKLNVIKLLAAYSYSVGLSHSNTYQMVSPKLVRYGKKGENHQLWGNK